MLSLRLSDSHGQTGAGARRDVKPFTTLLGELTDFRCEDQGREVLLIARDLFGFDNLAYLHLRNHHFLAQVPYLVHTLPRGWGQEILSSGHAGLGIILREGLKRVTPLDVRELSEERAAEVLSLPRVGSRMLLLPVHGPGGDVGIMLAMHEAPEKKWQALRQRVEPQLIQFTVHLFDAFRILSGMVSCEPSELLTRRELECLHWCAQGKSYWETAVILGIAERTVNHHMKMVREKLQVQTNAQAVSKAHALGLVMPEEFMTQGLPAWQPKSKSTA